MKYKSGTMAVLLLCLSFLLGGCSFYQGEKRLGYNRYIADYPKYSKQTRLKTNKKKIQKVANKSLRDIIKPWLGTPYKYGGSSKKGTDCSGFVMNIIGAFKGVQLPHSSSASWKMGKSVSKKNLKPGDVVFFGNFFGINHNGVYVGNNQFAHASSSKGVIIQPLSNEYWAGKYKGARRF